MYRFFKKLAVITTMFLTASCSEPDIADRAHKTPKLDFRSFFNGKVTGVGTTSDWHGKVSNKFNIDMDCRWEGKIGIISEVFT
jgi:starvation-inducible outer membrane lipoprotein